MINISEKISSLRKAHNLTQEALGEAVGVSPQAVSKWEKGDSLPDISVIADLCRVLGISADALLGSEGNMTAELYIDKAKHLSKGVLTKAKLANRFLAADPSEYKGFGFCISDATGFYATDNRGFGVYFTDIEYIKNMMAVDLTKSGLLKLMADEKALKIFSLICINGRLNDREIIKITGFSQQEAEQRIFALLKCSVISTVMEKNNGSPEMAYQIADNGILLLGIMANVFLFEPEAGKGTDGSGGGRHTNNDNLRKFMD
jgi:transcriptional regulator with XRE-family HTH domain